MAPSHYKRRRSAATANPISVTNYYWAFLIWVEPLPTIHRSRMRQHDCLTASQHPLQFQQCGSAFQNLMNSNTLSNTLVNTRQELWLAESDIPPPREKCSAQAGLPESLKPCAEILALRGCQQTCDRKNPKPINSCCLVVQKIYLTVAVVTSRSR